MRYDDNPVNVFVFEKEKETVFAYFYFCQGTEDTELTLTREGDFVGSEDDNVEEINIFEGQFNRITFEQVD